MPERTTVLVIDEDAESRRRLSEILRTHGYAVIDVAGEKRALAALRSSQVQAAVVAVGRGWADDLSILRQLVEGRAGLPIVVVTAVASMDLAVQAMKLGARDVVGRPIPETRLLAELREGIRAAESRGTVPTPAGTATREMEKLNIIGHSRAMLELFDTIKLVAPRASRVLVMGESGTGKELVARALHDLGSRSGGPLVAVNCATLSDQILESELFGHERGAFTSADQMKIGVVEAAHRGTLFLDEINEMGASCQAKLLRVLERKEFRRVGGTKKIKVDFNLIAATNADLARCVVDGRFRSDLYYRLKVVTLQVPPLRTRREAIPVLAARFLTDIAAQVGVEPKTLSADALAALERYSWPGNVRELHNCIESLTLTVRKTVIDVSDVPEEMRDVAAEGLSVPGGGRLEDAERELIARALQRHPTVKEAAKALGIGERTVYAKVKKYGLPTRSPRGQAS